MPIARGLVVNAQLSPDFPEGLVPPVDAMNHRPLSFLQDGSQMPDEVIQTPLAIILPRRYSPFPIAFFGHSIPSCPFG